MSALEAAILSRAINPKDSRFKPEVAEALLDIQISEFDQVRALELAQKGNEGLLSPDEEEEANSMERVGLMISLLKSKARISLAEKV